MSSHLFLTLGPKRCDSQTTVELQDGEDGGIIMDIHSRRRSRGSAFTTVSISIYNGILCLENQGSLVFFYSAPFLWFTLSLSYLVILYINKTQTWFQLVPG